MDPLKTFFQENAPDLTKSWTLDQKADELGMWALERGYGDLPELDIGEGTGVPQEAYDRAVEEAFTFLRGEAYAFLK